MPNRNRNVVMAYFASAEKADEAASQLKSWDQANEGIKLGGIGILVMNEGKIETRRVGARMTGAGAKAGATPAGRVVELVLTSSDPEDLTLRQARLLGEADTLLIDGAVPPAILARARADAIEDLAGHVVLDRHAEGLDEQVVIERARGGDDAHGELDVGDAVWGDHVSMLAQWR